MRSIIAGVVSIIVSVVLLFVWPVVFTALITVGQSIAKMGAVGAGIYAFLNRLLIPTGLHHALNNVFWFDTIGLGDLTHSGQEKHLRMYHGALECTCQDSSHV